MKKAYFFTRSLIPFIVMIAFIVILAEKYSVVAIDKLYLHIAFALLALALPIAGYFYFQAEETKESQKISNELNPLSLHNNQTLFKDETLSRCILESLSTHLAVINIKGEIIATNEAWKSFAINNHTATNGTCEDSNYFEVCEKSALQGDGFADSALTGMKQVLNGSKPFYYTEYPYHSSDKQRWFSMRVVKLQSKENMAVVAHEDITLMILAKLDSEKLAFDLIQRNNDIEQFSYIVSHNLRAPLANILGFAELLKYENTYPEEHADVTNGIFAAASKLDEVVKDLNDILQVRSQILENKETVSFQDTVRSVSLSINNIIKEQNISIKTNFAIDKMVTVRSYLYSIFYNLIYNSIKYQNPEQKTLIEITSKKNSTGLQLIFRDNGLGIDLAKNGEKLFGLYKRFHLNTQSKGMGLFMVKTQVETLGGKISVNSTVNKGTEFIIEFENQYI